MGQEPARVLLGTGARQHLRACFVALGTVSSIRETFLGCEPAQTGHEKGGQHE
jgi:hypothetical protein